MAGLIPGIRKKGTVKQKKTSGKEDCLFLQEPYAGSLIVRGKLTDIVKLPKYMDLNEWLAANTYDFFQYTNLFYGSIAEYCTSKDCPTMSAGESTQYLWSDSDKKSQALPAPQYIDTVMSYIETQVSNQDVFPTKAGVDFPKDFESIVQQIFKRLFRVLAHMYHSHFDKIAALQQYAHLNTLFIHFVFFAEEFNLIDKKEFAPMSSLIEELRQVDDTSQE